jgi:hypothetical protein
MLQCPPFSSAQIDTSLCSPKYLPTTIYTQQNSSTTSSIESATFCLIEARDELTFNLRNDQLKTDPLTATIQLSVAMLSQSTATLLIEYQIYFPTDMALHHITSAQMFNKHKIDY